MPRVHVVDPAGAGADSERSESTRRHLRITLVNQYLPPDTAPTAGIFSDLARSFATAGHSMTAICGRPSYRPTDRRKWRLFRREMLGPVVLWRVGSTTFARGSSLARAINYLSFLALAAVRGLTLRRPDVVLTGSDPPLAVLAGLILARGGPVVYYIQDLHPEAALSAGWIRPGWMASGWRRLHDWALCRCELVVCLGDEMAAVLLEKGVQPHRVVIAANGAAAPAESAETGLSATLRAGASFVVVHAGNIGIAGAWDTIIEAARLLDGTVEFVFVGDGACESQIRAAGLRVEPFTQDIEGVMQAGDLQLVTLRSEMEGLIVPSKLYTALAHGRPIIGVVPTDSRVASVVQGFGCGVIANPDDPAGVAETIASLSRAPAALAQMAKSAQAAGSAFQRPAVFTPLVSFVERVARGDSTDETRDAPLDLSPATPAVHRRE